MTTVEELQVGIDDVVEKFNQNHEPAGSPTGGQFATGTGVAPKTRSSGVKDFAGLVTNGIYIATSKKPDELKSSVNATLSEIENVIVLGKIEAAHIISSKDGSRITSNEGHATGVTLSLEQRDTSEDNILTHNHPDAIGDMTFSRQDIRSAIRDNVLELRAVTSIAVYRLQRPADGWPSSFQVLKVVQRERSISISEFLRMGFNAGNHPPKSMESVARHTIMDRAMTTLEIPYSRELR